MSKQTTFCQKKFRSLLLTGTFSMALEYLMLLSDNIIIGNILGEEAIAGINLVTPLFSIAVFVSTMISLGTSICYSYEMGAFRKQEADCLFGQGVITAVGFGFLLFLLAFFGKNAFFSFMNPSETVEAYATGYYTYYQFIMLLYPIYALLIDMVYSDGDELICNISYAVQGVFNISLSILLCHTIGIQGASLGTLIGMILSISTLLIHFFRKQNALRFVPHFKFRDLWRIFKYSAVDSCLYLFWGLTSCVATKFVISRFGDYYLPVLSVVISVVELTLVFDGIGQAITPLANVYRGEKNDDGIRKVMKVALRAAVVEGLGASLLLLIFSEGLARLFGISDPALLAQCRTAVRLACPFMVFSAILFLFTTYYLIIEKIPLALLITAIKDCAAILLLILLGGSLMGIHGVWLGFGLAPALSIIISVFLVRARYGKQKFPLLLEENPGQIYSYDLYLDEKSVIGLRDQIEVLLTEHQIPKGTVMQVMLLVEEMGMLIIEKNPKKRILMECTIMLGNDLQIIFRDDGVLFDITDADNPISSIRSYVVANVMNRLPSRSHLVTTSYNRNLFCFIKS